MARFEQAAQEEAVAEARGRGYQFGLDAGMLPQHVPRQWGVEERGWDGKIGSATISTRPTTRYVTGPSRRQGTRRPFHQEAVSVPAPVSQIGTTVGEATTTPSTRPLEGRTREEAAITASSRHRGPIVARCHLFASLATNRATSPTSALRRRPRFRLQRLAPPAGPLRLHAS
jgi:hypothetical protein